MPGTLAWLLLLAALVVIFLVVIVVRRRRAESDALGQSGTALLFPAPGPGSDVESGWAAGPMAVGAGVSEAGLAGGMASVPVPLEGQEYAVAVPVAVPGGGEAGVAVAEELWAAPAADSVETVEREEYVESLDVPAESVDAEDTVDIVTTVDAEDTVHIVDTVDIVHTDDAAAGVDSSGGAEDGSGVWVPSEGPMRLSAADEAAAAARARIHGGSGVTQEAPSVEPESDADADGGAAAYPAVVEAVVEAVETSEAVETREPAEGVDHEAELLADEEALGADSSAESDYQAALDEMTAERDALAEQPAARATVLETDVVEPAGDVESDPESDVESDSADTVIGEADAAAGGVGGEWTSGTDDGREISTFAEVVDGGYGWGSAAPVFDGAMPLGHPVKANRAWMRFQEPGDPWYDQITADVWFIDADNARRHGFAKD